MIADGKFHPAMGWAGLLAMAALVLSPGASAQSHEPVSMEPYIQEPMPAGFRVVMTEADGPVYADANGRTVYQWPAKDLRNGETGDGKNKSICDDTHYKVSAGLMSPYPAGLELPEVETRPSCVQLWPPVLAPADARPVGRWTVVMRPDGRGQWAYDSFPLYTSVLDRDPGDVIGGNRLLDRSDAAVPRVPIGPRPDVPATFVVTQTRTGRLLTLYSGLSVYTSDNDGPNQSRCDASCLRRWSPVLAPATAVDRGLWSVIERAPGMRQWAFQKKPLYTRVGEERRRSFEGSDEPGWHNVYTQPAPRPPKDFSVQDTPSGQVLADARGMTIYVYHCGDDALDQLACDIPDSPQAYRLAICGGGDLARCLKAFPYVLADRNARSDNRIWSTMDIDPKTGHSAVAGAPDALHVWAHRQRPVFTCARDREPGQIECDGWGEFYGYRNGYHAFWLRDNFGDYNE